MGQVFISYGDKDSEYALKLKAALLQEGLAAWMDEGLDYGPDFMKVHDQHLKECTTFILVMTEEAFLSRVVGLELFNAQRMKKTILPLLLQGNPWIQVSNRPYEDVRGGILPSAKFFDLLKNQAMQPLPDPAPAVERFQPVSPFKNNRPVGLSAGNVAAGLSAPLEAYKGTEPYLFVSYAHLDKAIVFSELAYLHGQSYRIWYDEGIDPGNEWPEELANAITNSFLFVVFVTPNSARSQNVHDEIFFALNNKKPFLAIHLKETKLPPGLELRMGNIQAILRYQMYEEEYHRKIKKTLSPALLADLGGSIENRASLMQRANALFKEHNYPTAIPLYTHAMRLDPQDTEACTKRALAHKALKNYSAALVDFSRLIELSPNQSYAYKERGEINIALENYPAALADYNKAIAIFPDGSAYYKTRGVVYEKLGEKEKSEADYEKYRDLTRRKE
jgi:tetratricopeptide (TPR) repeat protein